MATVPKQGGLKALWSNKFVFGVAVFASMGGFLFGYDQGVMSNLLTTENFGAQFPRIYSDADIKGWVVSILQLGAFLGALFNGPFAQRFSRKYSMMTAVCIFIVGSILQAAAKNEAMIFVGRILAGFAIGMLSHVVPMYQSEISPPEIRGSLVALQQFAITVGILVSFWLDYGFHFIGGVTCMKNAKEGEEFDPYSVPASGCDGQKEVTWRVPLALQIVPSLILGFGMMFFPFSPRWLAQQGRNEEALAVVAKLRGLPAEHEDVQIEFKEIIAAVRFDELSTAEKYPGMGGFKLAITQYKTLFTVRPLVKRIVIGCLMQVGQQFTGINAIIYYAPTIFSGLGLDGNTTSLLATGIVGVINVVFTLPAIMFLDRFGRKKLLMVGAVGMGISHAIVAALSATYDGKFETNPGAGWAGVAFIYFFIANFAYSWGPIGWVLPSEIFPMSARSKAMSITTSVNWLMNFVIGRATPSMLRDIKYGTYILFACCCALMFLWVWFFVPETKGKTLEEMDHVFKDTSGAEDAARMARVRKEVGLPGDNTEHMVTADSDDLEKGSNDLRVDNVSKLRSTSS